MTSIDASQTLPQKALLAAPEKAPAPVSKMIVDVARETGVSPIKQMREMFKLQRKAGISFGEYYAAQHYRTDITSEEKLQFVGEMGSYKLNLRLSPAKLGDKRSFIRDKVLYTTMLRGMDMPTTETQAVAHTERGFGAINTLRTAADVSRFLKSEARYPVFAKPLEGSKSVGSALLVGIDADKGMIEMGNGKSFDIDAFAHEVIADYPEGFTFQSAVQQHKDITELAGQAVGTMRVVTIIEDDAPRVLYAVWKVPSPKAMSDNFWQSGSMLGAVDAETGQVSHAISGAGLSREVLEQHPVSGKSFAGFQVPHWDQVKEVARQGHSMFPEFGVFGWDIAITDEGPVIIECNANPFHTLYQLAHDRGINNADFAPIFDKVEARTQKILEERTAHFKKLRKEQQV
ncbi:sugar-transfer associated ATP-grasp domain-containing protein [Planktotalea sp.]|uniref:sugar-transfer associated ATP-grasp domain-containing protein n=1 Tax=Planktotalea sp. TaxID=2029877 RepID=UPI0032969BF5